MPQKKVETEWMYHAPAGAYPIKQEAPPCSQIAGIGGIVEEHVHEDAPPVRNRVLETDSEYVQLAKRGGRNDLLAFKQTGEKQATPQAYPRVDWYYLEDNALEKREEEKHAEPTPYHFQVPEFIAHQEYSPSQDDNTQSAQPKRAPYNFDEVSAFQRNKNPTDKNVHMPNVKPEGYGVRQNKMKNQHPQYKTVKPERARGPQSEMAATPKYQTCALAEDNPPEMSKILSMGYREEWNAMRDEWQGSKTGGQMAQAQLSSASPKEKVVSEYQQQMYNRGRSGAKQRGGGRTRSKSSEERASLKAREETKEKELFKMARFRNVGARTDSHRPHSLTALNSGDH